MPEIDIADMPVWDGEHACWLVKKTEHFRVEIYEMIFNYRVVVSHLSDYQTWLRAWCFFGHDAITFARAITAARSFDPEVDAEPTGYDKALL